MSAAAQSVRLSSWNSATVRLTVWTTPPFRGWAGPSGRRPMRFSSTRDSDSVGFGGIGHQT